MSKLSHTFEVTVSRVNEGPNDPPYETHTAQSVSVGPDGRLNIQRDGSSRSLVGWDSFEVRRITKSEPNNA